MRQFLADAYGREPTEEEAANAIDEIVTGCRDFCYAFKDYPFLTEEPVHEFVALSAFDPDTKQVDRTLELRFVISKEELYIESPVECPLDDSYHVRKVCVESNFPEHNDDEQDPEAPQN